MAPTAPLIALAVALGTIAGFPASARADRADEVKKQKSAAQQNAQKAGVAGLSFVESDDLLVFAAVPEDKARPLAESLQKTFELSRKTLKFGPDEKLWPGKLTVYVLTDSVHFTSYVRLVEQRRPDKGVTHALNLRGELPYALYSIDAGERISDAELAQEAAALVGAALLNKKARAELPEWLKFGFGRVIAIRAEGNPARTANFKARARSAVLGTKARPSLVRPPDVWGGLKTKDSPVVAASFVEYLTFGPEAERFSKFLSAFKPSDDQPQPSVETALAEVQWRPEVLEIGWKQWVARYK